MSRFWFFYLVTFASLTMLMQVGESSVALLSADDVNSAVGFQVDKVGSGSGFVPFLRTVSTVLTDFLPKAISFNYTFLQGDLELVRWFLMLTFGATPVFVIALNHVGVLQRNV